MSLDARTLPLWTLIATVSTRCDGPFRTRSDKLSTSTMRERGVEVEQALLRSLASAGDPRPGAAAGSRNRQ
jgi:hypothetical protein